MSKRLQVLLDEAEYQSIQDVATARHMTVAEWVRQALRAARRNEPRGDLGRKLDAVRAAVRCNYPSGDVESMLAQIEQGYLGTTP